MTAEHKTNPAMKRLLVSIAVLAIPLGSHGQVSGKAVLSGAALVDLGRYPAHEARAARFTLRNDGQADLKILKMRSGCSCTETAVDRLALAPGETATVTLTLRARSLRGAYTKYAYVETTDRANRILRLGVSGEAVPLVEVRPSLHVYGGRLTGKTDWSRKFLLSGDGIVLGEPHVESSHGAQATLAPAGSNGVQRLYNLAVTLPATTTTGPFSCTVSLPLIEPSGHPPVRVTLSAKIGVDLVAIPRVLHIPLSRDAHRRDIRLRIAGSRERVLNPSELVLPELDQVTFTVQRDPWHGLRVRAQFGPLFTERLMLSKRSELRFSVPGAAPVVVECRYKE